MKSASYDMPLFAGESFALQPHLFESSILGREIQRAVQHIASTPIQRLPPPEPFSGSGVYLLYYIGSFELYSALVKYDQGKYRQPIYAGKAVPKGGKRGCKPVSPSMALYRRLRKHAKSINDVSNLVRTDFACQFLVLTGDAADAAATIEYALIRKYAPVWNCCLDGFGNNAPGGKRETQLLAPWDTLHPGRDWERKWKGRRPDSEELRANVLSYLGRYSSTTDS